MLSLTLNLMTVICLNGTLLTYIGLLWPSCFCETNYLLGFKFHIQLLYLSVIAGTSHAAMCHFTFTLCLACIGRGRWKSTTTDYCSYLHVNNLYNVVVPICHVVIISQFFIMNKQKAFLCSINYS